MTFDVNKPHAQICGDSTGRAFEQGGKFYRADGSLWDPAPAVVTPVAAAGEPASEPDPKKKDKPLPIKVVPL